MDAIIIFLLLINVIGALAFQRNRTTASGHSDTQDSSDLTSLTEVELDQHDDLSDENIDHSNEEINAMTRIYSNPGFDPRSANENAALFMNERPYSEMIDSNHDE